MPGASAFVCNFTDCEALLKFKAGITSDPKGYVQDWNEVNPFCNWTGVTCHQSLQNRVIDLEITDMRLEVSISPFLSNLSLLTKLSLQGNNFHGEIPTTLGALSQLEYLNISENKLSGALPASLHGCQSLKFLDLSVNNLSGVIPEELGWMKKLGFFSSLCKQPHWGHSGLFVKPDRIDTTRTGCELLYWATPCGAWSFEQA